MSAREDVFVTLTDAYIQIAQELSRRLSSIFLRDKDGRRPAYGGTRKFQEDPHWRDLLLFYEYFHGDNGAGLGASHQTGWTGVGARMVHLFATTTGPASSRSRQSGSCHGGGAARGVIGL